MKSNYEERAKKFIHQIYSFIRDCYETDDYAHAVDSFNYIYNRKVYFAHGLTRVAFITSDYVVKINCGTCYALEQFGDCEKEMEVYEMAEENGFEYLFAKITRYCYKDMTFYIMPRIGGIGRYPCDADRYMSYDERCWCTNIGIFDLHNLNYGWRNHHVCLIDYAAAR